MKHMIKWLKVCALLLAIMLIVHILEIGYDIVYHSMGTPASTLFEKH